MLRLLDNPITQAEGRYQRRSTGSKWRLPIRAALYLALVIALILIGGAFVNALARQGTRSLVETLTLPALLLGIIALATYVWMPVQALMLASESIGREKRLGTWETLLLAGVDAGQIVRGKWWATMRHIWPDFLLAGVLRLAVMTWIGLFLAIDGSRPLPVYPDPLAMLLSGAIAILLSVVSAGLATTCGLLASLMSQRSGTALAMILYIVVLLAVVIVLGLGAHFFNWRHYLASSVYIYDYTALSWQLENVLSLAASTMVDQGAMLTSTLLQYQPPYAAHTYYYAMNALAGGSLASAIYLALTHGVLRLAQSLAVRQGALPSTHHPATGGT